MKNRWVKVFFIPVLSVLILLFFHYFSAQSSNKAPSQPVLFSHKIHAGDNQIPCQYCHSYVEMSPVAGIPSVQKCMGCHSHIAGKDEQYDYDGMSINIQSEINKVKGYWERKEPIPWIKVNMLPEIVHFNHKRHIKRGFECRTCHGEVENMDVVRRVHTFSMGFCITCHQQEARDENELTQLRDCLTCHY